MPIVLALLVLTCAAAGGACARRVTAPQGPCPDGQVQCRVPRGAAPPPGAPALACVEPCAPGEDFGPGVGRCDDAGCPVYFLP